MQADSLTANNLAAGAAHDAQHVISSIPGGAVTSQRSSTFAGSPAYIVALTATDGSAGTIDYVYNVTAQGNLIIVTHTQRTGRNIGISSLEQNWSWQPGSISNVTSQPSGLVPNNLATWMSVAGNSFTGSAIR